MTHRLMIAAAAAALTLAGATAAGAQGVYVGVGSPGYARGYAASGYYGSPGYGEYGAPEARAYGPGGEAYAYAGPYDSYPANGGIRRAQRHVLFPNEGCVQDLGPGHGTAPCGY